MSGLDNLTNKILNRSDLPTYSLEEEKRCDLFVVKYLKEKESVIALLEKVKKNSLDNHITADDVIKRIEFLKNFDISTLK